MMQFSFILRIMFAIYVTLNMGLMCTALTIIWCMMNEWVCRHFALEVWGGSSITENYALDKPRGFDLYGYSLYEFLNGVRLRLPAIYRMLSEPFIQLQSAHSIDLLNGAYMDIYGIRVAVTCKFVDNKKQLVIACKSSCQNGMKQFIKSAANKWVQLTTAQSIESH